MNKALRRKIIITAAAWAVALLIFFPILWMFLTGFKTEVEAIAIPPSLFFTPTLENYVAVRERADYFKFFWNSIYVSVGSTVLALVIAVPCSYAMAFFVGKRTKDTLVWMLSTKALPAVGEQVSEVIERRGVVGLLPDDLPERHLGLGEPLLLVVDRAHLEGDRAVVREPGLGVLQELDRHAVDIGLVVAGLAAVREADHGLESRWLTEDPGS